jgi:uncharacterized protein YkwD
MRRIGRLIVAVTAVALVLVLAPGTVVGGVGAVVQERKAMLHATNNTRDHHSIREVRINRVLSELARRHSLAMARRGTLFHTADPVGRYLRGLRWHAWGENVGVTSGTVRELQQAFMASLPHRQNILRTTYRHVAIGAVRADGTLWVTVFFYG